MVLALTLALLLPLIPGIGHGPRSAAGPQAGPDLVITDVWLQGEQVCTQVRNVGDGPSPAGHVTALSIDGQVVLEHSHSLAAPAPGLLMAIDDVWDTSGAAPDPYRIVATLAYDGRVAGPALVEVQCGRRVYLPLITRAGTVGR